MPAGIESEIGDLVFQNRMESAGQESFGDGRMEKRTGNEKWKWLLCLCVVSLFVWIVLKYLLRLFLPLVFAFLAVRIVYPGAVRLKKFGKAFHVSLSAKICRLTVFFAYLFLAAAFFFGVFAKLCQQIKKLLGNIGIYRLWMESFLGECCGNCDRILGLSQGESFRRLAAFAQGDGSRFFQKTFSGLSVSAVSFLKSFGSVGFLLLFSVLFTVMALTHLEQWYRWYRHCGFYQECHEILRELTGAGYAYIRTQAMVIFFISILCVLGLFLMGNPYPLLCGTGIALIDALPVLGSGTVFFPWMAGSLIFGKFSRAVWLLVLYAGCQLIRQFLEPRLMGKRLHIEPAVMLMSIFVGIKLFSIAGVLLGPVGFLLIRAVMSFVIRRDPAKPGGSLMTSHPQGGNRS